MSSAVCLIHCFPRQASMLIEEVIQVTRDILHDIFDRVTRMAIRRTFFDSGSILMSRAQAKVSDLTEYRTILIRLLSTQGVSFFASREISRVSTLDSRRRQMDTQSSITRFTELCEAICESTDLFTDR